MSNSTPSHSAQADSASPPAKGLSAGGSHTRTYQACIPCRRRKVRCDLGPVDNPHDPPCVRCRRESKECFFSATRRKRKPQDGGEGLDDDGPSDFEIHNGRKRLREDSETPRRSGFSQHATTPSIERPLTPGGSVGRLQPLRRPNAGQQSSHDDQQQVNNETTAILQSKEVFSGHDALNLLFEAAGRTGDMDHHRSNSTSMHQRTLSTASLAGTTPNSQPNLTSPGVNGAHPFPSPSTRTATELAIDPAIAPGQVEGEVNSQGGFEQAVKAWSRFRFVRAGWFTAREGIAYLDYFYRYLSPLTPIVVPNFEKYESHQILLTEEPMLVVTLLTVSSRYMALSGPGSSSRPYAIHEKLWNYLQGMIDRMIWGQEQFGGGFCGAGAEQGCDVNPLSRKGLRTLGTVESLMLLTEWHPRALHFPPGDDDDELMAPDEATMASMVNGCLSEAVDDQYRGSGGQRIDSWLEPCWRSDRMCWMLLGNALALAYEIGVFDDKSETEFHDENKHLPPAKEYKKLLAEFQPLLREFRSHLDRYKNIIPKLMHEILAIEYEYSRVYINSLALQAVVERCVTNTHAAAAANEANGLGSIPAGTIPPHMLVRWYGDDRHFIREVVDGCRNVLIIVTKGLEPGGYLKHAPVRTFFRIISVTIILLKTFALGATEDDVALSLGLMEEAVSALRNCIVDDVHVGNRFADMLITLITRIKSRFHNNFGNPMMPPPHPGQGYNNSANGNNPQWSNYNSSGLSGPTSPAASNGRATPNPSHPLWGISTETYDPGSNNISIMPPPTFGSPYNSHSQVPNNNGGSANSNSNQFGGFGSDGNDYGGFGANGGADWLALPLDPLLNSYGVDVNSNAYGPDVGGYDLLDVLLNGTEGLG
ncbi:putative fungal zn binuclear cluster domain containing protein [Neofusicoccum parvum UCRNP2]|uniref:Putative fungal zn binuclear cluster domain containing protein n=1 Tax=Botryosphaeria parva (strain UCR-NP2) TaxID=1287680 RepID=R1E975_BOTPV|nr:putative fungal zn binuclear cluster domain containing protein [Neofusicoccum parvum UCRNP2]